MIYLLMYLLTFLWRVTLWFWCGQHPLQGPLEGVGLENQDFFGVLNGNEQSKCHLGPKKSRFLGPKVQVNIDSIIFRSNSQELEDVVSPSLLKRWKQLNKTRNCWCYIICHKNFDCCRSGRLLIYFYIDKYINLYN
jgi:hypothetical protein